MKLTSERLECWPLTLSELAMFSRSRTDFEKVMGLMHSGIVLSEEISDGLSALGHKISQDPKESHLLFSTLWLIVERSSYCIVGQFCFNGLPDEQGRVGINFGIETLHRGNGYAQEAVGLIIAWLKGQGLAKILCVEIEMANLSAVRALNNLEFSLDTGCREDCNYVCYFFNLN